MIMPINCPICAEPFINDFQNNYPGSTEWIRKSCRRRLDHVIVINGDPKNETSVNWISGILSSNICVIWWFSQKKITLQIKGGKECNDIPFFEPDFSNYKRLIEKLKTYILFS